MKACATGEHIKDATITVRKAGKGQQEYLVITMTDVLVTSVSTSVSAEGEATIEGVALAFAKVDLEYKPQKPDGSLDAGLHFKYDLKANKVGLSSHRPEVRTGIPDDGQNRRSEALSCQCSVLGLTHEQPAGRPPPPGARLRPPADRAARLRRPRPLWSMSPAPARRHDRALPRPGSTPSAPAPRRGRPLRCHHRDRCRTAADWIAIETRQVRRDARSDLRLAQALDRHDVLSAAMAEGRVNTAQARAIVAALDRLPTTGEFAVSAEQRRRGRDPPGRPGEHHDAKALRILGGRIFEVIAPDLAEKFDGRALEAEEALALRRTTLTMCEDDEGTCHGRFRIPALHGQMLTKMILAISSPRPPHTSSGSTRPAHPGPARHRADPADRVIPGRRAAKTGGCSATVVVR